MLPMFMPDDEPMKRETGGNTAKITDLFHDAKLILSLRGKRNRSLACLLMDTAMGHKIINLSIDVIQITANYFYGCQSTWSSFYKQMSKN